MSREPLIEHVEAVRVEGSLWGAFWDVQKSAPSVGPMSRYEDYAVSLETWWWPQAQVLVRVASSDGATGFGWAEDGTGGASQVIERHLKGLLIGQPAASIERLWDQMYRASIPYGRGGILMHAISAIDIALWDLKGRALGQPVHALLGGARRKTMKAYASQLHPVATDKLIAEARGYVAEGYSAMKMRMASGPLSGEAGIRRNEDLIAHVRDAVGDGIELMVDAYMGWDLRFALRMARVAEAFHIGWIEEPLLPDESDAYVTLNRNSSVTIAHGENVFTPWEFLRLAQASAAGLLQPDVHRCGGITGFKRIAAMAETFGIEIAPHAFSAPTVHVCSTLGNCRLLEKLTVPCWATQDVASTPPLILGEPEVIKGEVTVGDAPGFGVRLNADVAPHLASWN